MKNVDKIGDALWDSPGHAFELHFGVFWGRFGEPWGVTLGKKGVQKGIQKMMQKTGLRGTPGNLGGDPVRPYKPSFLEPRGLQGSLDC